MTKESGKGSSGGSNVLNPKSGGGIVPLYAVPIHHCIAKGDLQEMKDLLVKAEEYVRDHGDVAAAIEALKIEIAKREYK